MDDDVILEKLLDIRVMDAETKEMVGLLRMDISPLLLQSEQAKNGREW
jgi:hypothetical protein